MTSYIFLLAVALIAGCISGIVGTGSSILLLPVLVFVFGPKEAIPIMAVASVMGNLARVLAWRREVDWKACAAYSAPGVVGAALGAKTLLILPSSLIEFVLGIFFLVMVPGRRYLARTGLRINLWQLGVAGALIGFVTGIVLSTGPLSVPAFTAYGLAQGAFLSTEAASSLLIYLSKVVTFRQLGALPEQQLVQGLIVGSAVMAGAFAGKSVVLRLSPDMFRHLLDAIMLCSGLSLIWEAVKVSL